MSVKNNRKILISSIIQRVNKNLILGDVIEKKPISLLSAIIDSISYCKKQGYTEKIKVLDSLIFRLKYECPSICNHKDRNVITNLRKNTAPIIRNKTYTIPFIKEYTPIIVNDLALSFFDAEGDNMKSMLFSSVSDKRDIQIGNKNVVVGKEYITPITLKTKYHRNDDVFFHKNNGTLPCAFSTIIAVERTKLEEALNAGYTILNVYSDCNMILQRILPVAKGGGEVVKLPYSLDKIAIPAEALGSFVETTSKIRVIDDDPINPLKSNIINMAIRYLSQCDDIPNCEGDEVIRPIAHGENHIFSLPDFTSSDLKGRVKITELLGTTTTLELGNLPITLDLLPISIPVSNIINGDLIYHSVQDICDPTITTLKFTLALKGSVNFCNTEGTIIINKAASTSDVCTECGITIDAGTNIRITTPTDVAFASTTLRGMASDSSGGSITTRWSYIGSTGIMIASPTSLTTEVTNIPPGQHTLTLNADNTVCDKNSNISIIVTRMTTININAGPIIRANINQTVNLLGTATATHNNPVTLVWSVIGNSNGVRLTQAVNSSATVTSTVAGEFTLRLTATVVGVTPIITRYDETTLIVGTGVTLSGTSGGPYNNARIGVRILLTGNITASDNSPVTLMWSVIPSTRGNITSEGSNYYFTATTAGLVTVRLSATHPVATDIAREARFTVIGADCENLRIVDDEDTGGIGTISIDRGITSEMITIAITNPSSGFTLSKDRVNILNNSNITLDISGQALLNYSFNTNVVVNTIITATRVIPTSCDDTGVVSFVGRGITVAATCANNLTIIGDTTLASGVTSTTITVSRANSIPFTGATWEEIGTDNPSTATFQTNNNRPADKQTLITGLIAGTYSFKVTTFSTNIGTGAAIINGCQEVTITVAATIATSFSVVINDGENICGADDTNASEVIVANVTPSTGTYTYLWSVTGSGWNIVDSLSDTVTLVNGFATSGGGGSVAQHTDVTVVVTNTTDNTTATDTINVTTRPCAGGTPAPQTCDLRLSGLSVETAPLTNYQLLLHEDDRAITGNRVWTVTTKPSTQGDITINESTTVTGGFDVTGITVAGDYTFKLTIGGSRCGEHNLTLYACSGLTISGDSAGVTTIGRDLAVNLPTAGATASIRLIASDYEVNTGEVTPSLSWTQRAKDPDTINDAIIEEGALTGTFSNLQVGAYIFKVTQLTSTRGIRCAEKTILVRDAVTAPPPVTIIPCNGLTMVSTFIDNLGNGDVDIYGGVPGETLTISVTRVGTTITDFALRVGNDGVFITTGGDVTLNSGGVATLIFSGIGSRVTPPIVLKVTNRVKDGSATVTGGNTCNVIVGQEVSVELI